MADQKFQTETQKQRWVKYGANVVLATVVVIALGVTVTVLAQGTGRRVDTTAAGVYSLKPQTVNIIRDLKAPIKLVSLYTDLGNADGGTDYAQTVADLLDEYKRKGKNIEVEIIDPVNQPTKVDDLIADVTNKYGGEVAKYREVTETYGKTYADIKAITDEELKKVSALQLDNLGQDPASQGVLLAFVTVQEFPRRLSRSEERIKRLLATKPPDYKAAVESVNDAMELFSQSAGGVVENFNAAKDDPKVPEALRQYMAASVPQYEKIRKLADDQVAKIKALGELKLDDLRQKLREQNAILVLGPNDMRSLSFNQVWTTDNEELRRMQPGAEPRAQFAGEQQVTAAILSLASETKPKVVFVRPGGAPLTSPGFPPFVPGGPFSDIADRLRDYNFEVLEKDLSGMWAMQAQMRGQPAEPEPSDEEIKDAVWIVISMPQQQAGPMGAPPPSIAPKVAEHLKNGGSALTLFLPNGEDLSEALKPWGVSVDTNAIIVHEQLESISGPTANFIEEAKRIPFIFVLNQYGDHLLTQPLRALDGLILPMLPVRTTAADGYKATPLLPTPTDLKVWAERDVEKTLQAEKVTFDPPKDGAAPETGDIPPPLFAGAAVEKTDGKGRLVAIGSAEFMANRYLRILDPELAQRNIPAARFPANAELVTNSVFWLSHMEPLIAISPAAMDVNRIEPMSDGTLRAWRVGVLLIGLPAAVIAAGLGVYFMRRD